MERKTVAVIGANGIMGRYVSAIFASFGNAKVYMVGRDRAKVEAVRTESCLSVRAQSIQDQLIPADYKQLRDIIQKSDIVFESTAEDWNVKTEVTKLVAENTNPEKNQNTVFCTGSSGLSVTRLAELYPQQLRENYMGVHLFNPPYSMTLCEITPTKYSRGELVEQMIGYCQTVLLRTVVTVRDTPAFLANRIGFQFINEALKYANTYRDSGGIDYIDAILGPFTGRTMPPVATSDFVGLDIHKAIVDNIYNHTMDFAHESFALPEYAEKLLHEGKLGRKTSEGFYKICLGESGARQRHVYDIGSGTYRQTIDYEFPFVRSMTDFIRSGNYEAAFRILKKDHSVEAEICLRFLLNYVLYALSTAKEVGHGACCADDAMAAGFHWCPPLAMIQVLSGPDEFMGLCRERLPDEFLKHVDMEWIMDSMIPSRYDYRPFIHAQK